MAHQYGSRRNCATHRARGQRRGRVVGLGAVVGAVLAFGVGPLGAAPAARADVLDVVIDPILQPVQQALTGVTDVVSAIDPTTAMDAMGVWIPPPFCPVWI